MIGKKVKILALGTHGTIEVSNIGVAKTRAFDYPTYVWVEMECADGRIIGDWFIDCCLEVLQ